MQGCCLYSKGKNFRANHNRDYLPKHWQSAVVYIAKVRILEQITTASLGTALASLLLLI